MYSEIDPFHRFSHLIISVASLLTDEEITNDHRAPIFAIIEGMTAAPITAPIKRIPATDDQNTLDEISVKWTS